jgi:7-cyano-7-deazaguanine synthase
MKPSVILLSGGVDSATTLAIAKSEGFLPYTLSFDYGQRHRRELESAKKVAESLGVQEHLIISLDLRRIGGSALTNSIEPPKDRDVSALSTEIPITYVPARNTVFLSVALAWAEVLGCEDIFIGANAIDYSGYPDCRPEYLDAFERMANLATKATVEGKAKIKIRAPLLKLTKSEIIKKGGSLGLDYALTWSCYDPLPNGRVCQRCDSCYFRQKGFSEAGLQDPLLNF